MSLLSRFRGALVGAVVGDCLGAFFEMSPVVTVDSVIRFFEHLEETHAQGQLEQVQPFTDDTAMARSFGKSLVEKRRLDVTDLAHRFVDQFFLEPERGYGANVGTVFKYLREEKFKDPLGPAARQFGGTGSYGNGGAMRVAPAALFGYKTDENTLDKLVEDSTRITHTHPDAIHGAILQCAAVKLALQAPTTDPETFDRTAFLSKLKARMEKYETAAAQSAAADEDGSPLPKRRAKRPSEDQLKPYCFKMRKISEYIKEDYELGQEEFESVIGNDISALAAVPAAIYSFTRCTKPIKTIARDNPFERTILHAISLGGDTDTIATMAGAMAGACYGVERVPVAWQEACEGVQDAVKLADQLYDLQETEGDRKESSPEVSH